MLTTRPRRSLFFNILKNFHWRELNSGLLCDSPGLWPLDHAALCYINVINKNIYFNYWDIGWGSFLRDMLVLKKMTLCRCRNNYIIKVDTLYFDLFPSFDMCNFGVVVRHLASNLRVPGSKLIYIILFFYLLSSGHRKQWIEYFREKLNAFHSSNL
jgi:hypothetical protein